MTADTPVSKITNPPVHSKPTIRDFLVSFDFSTGSSALDSGNDHPLGFTGLICSFGEFFEIGGFCPKDPDDPKNRRPGFSFIGLELINSTPFSASPYPVPGYLSGDTLKSNGISGGDEVVD